MIRFSVSLLSSPSLNHLNDSVSLNSCVCPTCYPCNALASNANFLSSFSRAFNSFSVRPVRALRERHNTMHSGKEETGDVVMIKGEEKNSAHWKTGRITDLMQGRDNIVREVRLQAGKSFMERPVQFLFYQKREQTQRQIQLKLIWNLWNAIVYCT